MKPGKTANTKAARETAVAAALANGFKPASVAAPATTAANVTRVKLEWNESVVGVACRIKECDWSSPLAKKADCGSYSIAGFESSV
jgi:hypothetical protein